MTYGNTITALADPTRRLVLETLVAKPAPVGVLAESLPVSRPAVSQHLKVLSDAGLVCVEKVGTRNIYAVRPEGLADLRRYIESFWGDVLGAFAEHIDNEKGDLSD